MNPYGRPSWLIRPAPDTNEIDRMEQWLGDQGLATVCQSAHCPNLGECFGSGTATFMIMGNVCTRNCRFCAVEKGAVVPPDPEEPARLAGAARHLCLKHVVVTSVTRDDLPDGGAGHFARVIEQLRLELPEAAIEVLVPDFQGSVSALDIVLAARPDVFNHNIETVARLYTAVRPQARYQRSLDVLRYAAGYGLAVKSGLMLGLGETQDEIRQTIIDLKRTGCRYLTIGQYLAPSPDHVPIDRYVSPDEFEKWRDFAIKIGFTNVASGPLVRSSYRAEDMHYSAAKITGEESVGSETFHSGTGHGH
jgi:lipoic acid synthetase